MKITMTGESNDPDSPLEALTYAMLILHRKMLLATAHEQQMVYPLKFTHKDDLCSVELEVSDIGLNI